MDQAIEIAPSDYWRWYLMANAPEGSDAASLISAQGQIASALGQAIASGSRWS